MSKLNILGIVNNIRSKTNVYTPIIEAIVNSIESIEEAKNKNGQIQIIIKRENRLELDPTTLPEIKSIEIQDNGIGFIQKNRDSFDTFYGEDKKNIGGKGFGRFMFLKYFANVRVESTYLNTDIEKGQYYTRKFSFGKEYDIIINESNTPSNANIQKTSIYLDNLKESKHLDKDIDTIARKLLEKLLIFFINENFKCPIIRLQEEGGRQEIILNNYLASGGGISKILSDNFTVKSSQSKRKEEFEIQVFKIYFPGSHKSKICLAAHNREVTETTLHTYIPEFADDFFDQIKTGENVVNKNFIIRTYVTGTYLDSNVSLERETFNFSKDESDPFYELSQTQIEREAAEIVGKAFKNEVKVREEKKKSYINDYVNTSAPWHRHYIEELDLSKIAYHVTEESIELELQKLKFHKEQASRKDLKEILISTDQEFETKFKKLVSNITTIGKNDLAHYVCNRKVVLSLFEELQKRNQDGSASYEKEIHDLIFPMGGTSQNTPYQNYNLWLIDERLVFSQYIASDKKISSKKSPTEPDLVIFDKKQSFRSGDNEFSNPLTIFEFKRPKRENYTQDEDPILQIGNYLEEIRAEKYEMPDGSEKIKVNDNTPVYGYVICDITKKVKEFAKINQLILSPDNEGYFGFHVGYKMYVEIISFKKLLKDATLRNKIFFKMLQLE